ncbi:MAG: response regulator [Pyrinomonadaceae bacterium MAG19_C2-C3]|nr:response regulator [Pyrinomonadaceae bacterium MAG19_C2-C3]
MADARILIADDYEDNRELLRLMLETSGYKIEEARDGAECVQMARTHKYDLALIDLSMPILDGWSVLQEIKSNDGTCDLPCVAVTAFAADEDRQRALAAGFDAYLTKPYRSKDLLDLVASLLTRRNGQQAS